MTGLLLLWWQEDQTHPYLFDSQTPYFNQKWHKIVFQVVYDPFSPDEKRERKSRDLDMNDNIMWCKGAGKFWNTRVCFMQAQFDQVGSGRLRAYPLDYWQNGFSLLHKFVSAACVNVKTCFQFSGLHAWTKRDPGVACGSDSCWGRNLGGSDLVEGRTSGGRTSGGGGNCPSTTGKQVLFHVDVGRTVTSTPLIDCNESAFSLVWKSLLFSIARVIFSSMFWNKLPVLFFLSNALRASHGMLIRSYDLHTWHQSTLITQKWSEKSSQEPRFTTENFVGGQSGDTILSRVHGPWNCAANVEFTTGFSDARFWCEWTDKMKNSGLHCTRHVGFLTCQSFVSILVGVRETPTMARSTSNDRAISLLQNFLVKSVQTFVAEA